MLLLLLLCHCVPAAATCADVLRGALGRRMVVEAAVEAFDAGCVRASCGRSGWAVAALPCERLGAAGVGAGLEGADFGAGCLDTGTGCAGGAEAVFADA